MALGTPDKLELWYAQQLALHNERNVRIKEDEEKGVAKKISDEDKPTVTEAVKEALEWLDDNQDAEKEDFDEKLKEVQDACSPIISKVYRESGGAPGGGDFGGDDDLDGHDEL